MPVIINIDRLLQQKGMSARELAKRIGITEANLSVLKDGHARAVRFSTLEKLCRELECSPGDLIDYYEADPGLKSDES